MKILHVSYYDIKGGAGIAAYRLCRAQRRMGIDARMLVAEKSSDEPWITALPEKQLKIMRFLQRAENFVNTLFADKRNFMPKSLNLFSLNVSEKIIAANPDIVHLHWINGQMLSVSELAALPFPIVWTLHDTWAYCGSEHHHLYNDRRFADGYSGSGLEDIIWKQKKRAWQNFSPLIVGPSAWITAEAAESVLFCHNRCEHIFNGIDLQEFHPVSKEEARKYWSIPADKKVIVIGAFSFKDKNKGGEILRDTLAKFPDAVILATGGNIPENLHKNLIAAGRIDAPELLAAAYSAGDVFLSTALYDNLPNMLIEAVACGTPCVAVNTGGTGEIVCGPNGITVLPDSRSLAKAVDFILKNKENFSPSGTMFDLEKTVPEYNRIYQKIITEKI